MVGATAATLDKLRQEIVRSRTKDGDGQVPSSLVLEIFDFFAPAPSATAAQIADTSSDINTIQKYAGKIVWDSTNSQFLIATGSLQTDSWQNASTATTVSSVFGRSGAVVAVAGDYDDDEVSAAASATNYTPSAATVAGHLAGIDTVLGTPVSLAGSYDYLTVVGNVITRNQVDLSTDVTAQLPGTQVDLDAIGDPAHRNVQVMQDIFHSSGIGDGGVITVSATPDAVDVAAGDGWIRGTDDATDTLLAFSWGATSALSVPDNTTRYVGVEYNAGSPQVVVRATNSFTRTDEFYLGSVVNDGTNIHISENGYHVGDHASLMIARLLGTNYIAVDTTLGGLMTSEVGTRNLQVTAGRLWSGLASFDTSAVDTSGADTFISHYYNGSAWVVSASETQWDNTQYNDTASGLTTMTNNRWANVWLYMDLEGQLIHVYGQAEYVSQAAAEAEDPPSLIPDLVRYHAKLIARCTFQKSDGTFTTITSYTTSTPTGAGASSDHGSLAGLADDDHTQYLLADGTRDLAGDWSAAGFEIGAFKNKVVSVDTSGGDVTLTMATHGGALIRVTGGTGNQVIVPNSAGFSALIVAEAATTVEFNSTTAPDMANGDVMTVYVPVAGTVKASLTPVAGQVVFT